MLNIIPYPNGKAIEHSGFCALEGGIRLESEVLEPWCTEAFMQRMELEESDGGVALRLVWDESLAAEAYAMDISGDEITVHAASERGVIWALSTAANLSEDRALRCCHIEDNPLYPHRGLNLDCARHFFSAAEVKKLIDAISLMKLNVLHWHLSDDQGWRIESERFPELCGSGEYYTKQQISEICAYAKLRGVEIIPEIDLPGHTSAILSAYPHLGCTERPVKLKHSGGIFSEILCGGDERVFEFLTQLFDELCDLFPGGRFHIGGDEAPKSQWQSCPKCKKRMEELGITDFEDLQADFTRRVQAILKAHGKQCICWNETLRAKTAPEDIQVQYWTIQDRATMESFVNKGGQWIYSDMFELYLDYPHSMTPLKRLYKSVPKMGKREFTAADGLLGVECCLWTEHIALPGHLEKQLFPRAFAVAELAWSRKKDYADFVCRLKAQAAQPLYKALCMTEEPWWNPKGAERRRDAFAFFSKMNTAMSDEVRSQTMESSAPNMEYVKRYLTDFFRPWDLLFLLKEPLIKETLKDIFG